MKEPQKIPASFRDPSGFLFRREGVLYRQVNVSYQEHYDRLMESGLYQTLTEAELLVPHDEVQEAPLNPKIAYKIVRPKSLSFISYPYEWCFSQLKNAALTTLAIQKIALEHNMSLKDSSAYNIQFHNGNPILIDTLSFEIYPEGKPWISYRQFCQHFLAPLALMAYRDVRLGQLFRVYIDGVPLDLASKLLPVSTRLNFSLLTNIHLHATAQQRYADKPVDPKRVTRQFSKNSFLGLIGSLESGIRRLQWEPTETEWADYTCQHNYSDEAVDHKRQLLEEYIKRVMPESVWDLGANTGEFSRIASTRNIPTIAFDIDPGAVERNFLACVSKKEGHLLPLVLDLTNPSPSIGWNNEERMSFLERGPAGMVLALALVHHLAITNNVPLENLANFFAQLSRWLVIEFVPKKDNQVQKLLASREDIFPDYTQEGFEKAFLEQFRIHTSEKVRNTDRTMYLMERH